MLAIQLRQTMSEQVNGTACLPDTLRFIRGTAASCLRFPTSRSVHGGLKSGFQQTREPVWCARGSPAAAWQKSPAMHQTGPSTFPTSATLWLQPAATEVHKAEGNARAASNTDRGVPTTPGNDRHP